MTGEDYVIICGDFGAVWDYEGETKHEKQLLDWLDEKPFTVLFVDGNHENFDRLYSYPVEMWHGGKVHKIRPSVIHLMRGQIFEIEGKRIFTFGGASCHDISGGILDPEAPDYMERKRALNEEWIPYRVNHRSWWAQEIASEEEMEEGAANLETLDCKVDYIITHCCSTEIQKLIDPYGFYGVNDQTEYLEEIRNHVEYDKWYFGHYHDNRNISDKEVLLFEDILEIGEVCKEKKED